jgi:hypothetical protein
VARAGTASHLAWGSNNEERAMKNPWMSFWLSAANSAAGTARSFWMAEVQRQQRAFAKEVAKAWGLGPNDPRRTEPKRRKK